MIRVVTIAADVEREAALSFELEKDPRFEVVFQCFDRVETLAALRASLADVLVSVGAAPWFDYQCFEEATSAGIRLAGLAEDTLQREVLEISGFSVVSRLDDIEQLVVKRTGGAPCADESGSGTLLAVWGPKGAPGRTTVAIELAHLFSEMDPSTLLVDADTYGGDVAQLVGAPDGPSDIVTLAQAGARGELRDARRMSELMRIGRKGPCLVPGLLRAQLHGEVSSFGWSAVLRAARRSFQTTLVDVGFCLERAIDEHVAGRNDVAVATVEAAEKVVCVVRADPVGIRTFLWAVSAYREELGRERLVVAANRVRAGEQREIRSLMRRHLPGVPVVTIPDRPDLVSDAVWRAETVSRRHLGSDLADALRGLAEMIGGDVPPVGFLARLAGRSAR